VSRLHGRLRRLEQVALKQGCPRCAAPPAVVDLVGPDSTPGDTSELTPCSVCGERPQQIGVRLAFDPACLTDGGRNGCQGGEPQR
jgi:hypothetical protein